MTDQQVLDLAHCPMLTTLAGVAETMPNLHDVDLTDTGVGDADLVLLATHCHVVRCVAALRSGSACACTGPKPHMICDVSLATLRACCSTAMRASHVSQQPDHIFALDIMRCPS